MLGLRMALHLLHHVQIQVFISTEGSLLGQKVAGA